MDSLKVIALNSFISSFSWNTDELRAIKRNAKQMITIDCNNYYKNKLFEADINGQFKEKILSSFIKVNKNSSILISFRDPNDRIVNGDITYTIHTANLFGISRHPYNTNTYGGTPDNYTVDTEGYDVPSYFKDYGMFLWRTLIKD
jgi:hypothetical protein